MTVKKFNEKYKNEYKIESESRVKGKVFSYRFMDLATGKILYFLYPKTGEWEAISIISGLFTSQTVINDVYLVMDHLKELTKEVMEKVINVKITKEQFKALTEWKDLLENTKKDFEHRIFPESKDLSYTAPEVIKEQEVLKHRIILMTNLISFINEVSKETKWKN